MLFDPNNLPTEIFENKTSSPCIIYMGVGTHFNGKSHKSDWEHKYNQQFPSFIHDWKLNSPNTTIKIILFDSLGVDDPYIYWNTSSFYSNTFVRDSKYSNVFRSEFGIEVYSFPYNVNWFKNDFNRQGYYDISNILVDIVGKINDGYLFFYHEFTGRNPEQLEYEISQKVKFNDRRVCIDISRGRDLSCMVDFSEPENYPLILSNGFGDIEWLNIKYIPVEKQFELIDKFTEESKIDSEEFSRLISFTCPYLNSKVFEYYLYRQIKSKNLSVYNVCKKILYGIKSFYEISREFTIYDWENLSQIQLLKEKVLMEDDTDSDYIKKFNDCIGILKGCTDINILKQNKKLGLDLIKKIMFRCIKNIKRVDEDIIIDLFYKFDITQDKYKLVGIFNNFMEIFSS